MRMASKAEMILSRLFEAYVREPRMLPPDTQRKIEEGDDEMHRVICDYLAGMTDRYAIQEYNRLFDPNQRV
jgi:dGTPase